MYHLIPHTHWDREWYLTRSAFLARLVPVLDALLDQLARDPDARFVLDGQTVLVEDYLAVRPTQRSALARAVAAGALQVGPWYVLADEQIPTGESLVRNLLEGCGDTRELGAMPGVLYSPDAFGHPACLPALAAGFGLRSGVLWRGLGRPTGADHDLYRWIGPDGAALLLYHLPTDGYSVGGDLAAAGPSLLTRWRHLRRALRARSGTRHVAVFIGADHHAAAPDQAALRADLQAGEPREPVRLSSLLEFMDAVERATATVATVSGELRRIDGHTWVLQGVHGTRARLKRQHGAAELRLARIAEPLAALAGTDRRPLLRSAWRALLQCQFHDTLGGCCADAVAREQGVRIEGVASLAEEIATASLDALAGHDPDLAREHPAATRPALVLWNPLPRTRVGVTTAEVTSFVRDVLVGPPGGARTRAGPGHVGFVLCDGDGRTIPVQVLGQRRGLERLDATRHYPDQDEVDRVWVAFQAPVIPGTALRVLERRDRTAAPGQTDLSAGPRRLRNATVSLAMGREGAVTLTDHGTGLTYPGLLGFVGEADRGDTYTFSPGPGRVARHRTMGPPRLIAHGPLVAGLEVRGRMASSRGPVGTRLVATLHAGEPIVRIRIDLDNHAEDQRVRLRVPVGVAGAAVAGASFGLERRAPVPPGPHGPAIEQPVRTAPAHRYVAAAAGDRGLAVLAPGFFEYEWTPEGDLFITLLRSVGELSRAGLPERPGHAGWPQPTPEAQEPGRHTISLALMPISDALIRRPDLLERAWEDAFLPVQALWRRTFTGPTPAGSPSIELEGAGLVASAIAPAAAGGLIVRAWNALDVPADGAWRFTRGVRRATRIRLDETDVSEAPVSGGGRVVRFRAGPREIVTLRVAF